MSNYFEGPHKENDSADVSAVSSFQNIKKKLDVQLGERSYPIYIGHDLLAQAALIRPAIVGRQVMVVSNTQVAPLYLAKVMQSLASIPDLRISSHIFPDGESFKTIESLDALYAALLEQGFNRTATLIALGGGVVGDMTGFVAATYQRGVACIQVPTTLLSQVDSSVGGKTGVNHRLGKNMIGAFHQPKTVLIDIESLQTLPKREVIAGLAEVIKYGLIWDMEFLSWIEANMARLLALDVSALTYAIHTSCKIKADIVQRDEKESGVRALLNLGHTFGHAIEAGMGYGIWLHGEAVGLGLLMAADLSWRQGLITASDVQRVEALLVSAGLPTTIPEAMTPDRFLAYMQVDKKNMDERLRLVLLKALGSAFLVSDSDNQNLLKTLDRTQPFGVL